MRAINDSALWLLIEDAYESSRGNYGSPRIHDELKERGIRCGRKRIARIMRCKGIQGAHRRKRAYTTVKDNTAAPAPDLVDRNFTVSSRDRLWVADITYIRTWEGWLYLAVVLDAYSRKIVGWSMRSDLSTQLVTDALDMAVFQRRPAGGLIHHSDQGTQYTSLAFGRRCRQEGIKPSMGSVGDAYDNALAESFFATLETELLWKNRFRTRREARLKVFDYIEAFYNPTRRHSSLGGISPVEFERREESRRISAGLPERV